jgi:hypothetical protein
MKSERWFFEMVAGIIATEVIEWENQIDGREFRGSSQVEKLLLTLASST